MPINCYVNAIIHYRPVARHSLIFDIKSSAIFRNMPDDDKPGASKVCIERTAEIISFAYWQSLTVMGLVVYQLKDGHVQFGNSNPT